MAQISRPQKKDSSQQGLALASLIPGGIGAVAKGIGTAKALAGPPPQAPQLQQGAIQGRLQAQAPDPGIPDIFRRAELALQEVDPEVTAEVAPTLATAMTLIARQIQAGQLPPPSHLREQV